MLAIRLPEDVETRLACLARDSGRTKTFYAREAIIAHIENLEDLYLAEKRLIEHRAGRSESRSLEEVMKR
jgi:RHH-type rel operon transcriptional repressor/antitoxin RelB